MMRKCLRAAFMMQDPRQKNPKDGRNQPPDLDELWREFSRRWQRLWSRLLGKKVGPKQFQGDNNNGNLRPEFKRNGYYGVGVLSLVVGIWLGSGFYRVQPGQTSVVLQLGAYKKMTHTGWHWRLPYPLQSHEIVDTSSVRSIEVGRNNAIKIANLKDASMLTQDGKIIDLRFNVRYVVDDPRAFLFNRADSPIGIQQAAEAAVREVVGQRNMADLLIDTREQLGSAIAVVLQRNLDIGKSGIRIHQIAIQSMQPPEQMQAVSNEIQKISVASTKLKSVAQAYADEIIPAAQNAAVRMLDDAQNYKASVMAQAHGEVARFKPLLAEFLKAPAATREHMYLETMQQIYGNSTKVFVDGNKAASTQILLPFDGLKRNSSAASASPSNPSSTESLRARRPETDTEIEKGENTEPSNAVRSDRLERPEPSSANREALRTRGLLRDRERSEEAR